MTIAELIHALNAMVDNNIILPESEIEIHDVINDEALEIIGFDIYANGSLNIKARNK